MHSMLVSALKEEVSHSDEKGWIGAGVIDADAERINYDNPVSQITTEKSMFL